jgi:exosortase/archaeosortase family protein
MIKNWTDYVMFKKWSAIILLAIWIIPSKLNRKLIFTGILAVTHFISMISGLLILTLIGPAIYNSGTLSQLYPNIIGELVMITVLIIWIRINQQKIETILGKIKFNVKLSNRKFVEITVIVYVFSFLNNFIIPYFNFHSYVHFLLSVTKFAVSLLGYRSTIDGPYLIGDGGTLFMAKWCLGFLTMFVFASLIYITGKENKAKWVYIISGLVFLHIVNIIRLATLYIFVQNNDSQLASDHHDIYNLIFYAIIFILWIIWFEKFALKKKFKTNKS